MRLTYRHAYESFLERRFPWAVAVFVLMNVVAAMVQWWLGGFRFTPGEISATPTDWALGAKVPSLVAEGDYWRLVTANFLHGSLPHLGFNMAGLIVVGSLLEHYYGSVRFTVIYLTACLAGALASLWFTPTTSLGASTGVLGLLGATLVHHRTYRHSLPDRVNAVYPVLIVVLVLQLAFDQLQSRTVDAAGHIGGLLGGSIVAALLESRAGGRFQGLRDGRRLPAMVLAVLVALMYGGVGLAESLPRNLELLRAGRVRSPAAQVEQLELVLERRPEFVEARLYLIQLLLQLGRADDATAQHLAAKRSSRGLPSEAGRSIAELLADYHLRASDVAYRRGDWEASLASAREVIELDAGKEITAQARNQYAWVLVDKLKRDYESAEREIRLALRDMPDEAAFIDTHAWALYRLKRYDEALETQLRAIRKRGMNEDDAHSNAEYYYHLGAIQEALGDLTGARTSYARSAQSGDRFEPARESQRRLDAILEKLQNGAGDPELDPAITNGIL